MTRKASLGDRGDSAYESMGLRKYRAGFKKPVLKFIRMERDVVGKNSGQVGWGQALRLFTAVFRALRVGSEVWGRKSVAPELYPVLQPKVEKHLLLPHNWRKGELGARGSEQEALSSLPSSARGHSDRGPWLKLQWSGWASMALCSAGMKPLLRDDVSSRNTVTFILHSPSFKEPQWHWPPWPLL